MHAIQNPFVHWLSRYDYLMCRFSLFEFMQEMIVKFTELGPCMHLQEVLRSKLVRWRRDAVVGIRNKSYNKRVITESHQTHFSLPVLDKTRYPTTIPQYYVQASRGKF